MDFPELTREDLTAALEFSANRQHRTLAWHWYNYIEKLR
jgi:uncharacterized protein (DUF433 family)